MDTKQRDMKNGVVPARAIGFLWVLVLLFALFCMLIFFVPSEMLGTYRFFSNLFECAIALFCMLCCLYAYRTWSERILLLLAAFAFGGYALSNTFWYMYEIAVPDPGAFFTIAELGVLGFMLFFIVAFRIEFQKKICPVSSRIAVWGLFLIIALITLRTTSITSDTLMFMFILLIIALFMDAAIDHGVYRYSLLWSGICLWSFTLFLYGLRETIVDPLVRTSGNTMDVHSFIIIPEQLQEFLSIVGPLIIVSFLLIQLGIFNYLNFTEE